MGLIQPSRFQPTVFLLETFFFPCSKCSTLSLTGLDAFDAFWRCEYNNSNKTEGSLRSSGLSSGFLMETLMARPTWAFPGISDLCLSMWVSLGHTWHAMQEYQPDPSPKLGGVWNEELCSQPLLSFSITH